MKRKKENFSEDRSNQQFDFNLRIFVPYYLIPQHSIQFNSMQSHSIQFNSFQFNLIQFNSIQFIPIQFNSIQSNSIQFNSIRLHFLLFHIPPTYLYYYKLLCPMLLCSKIIYLQFLNTISKYHLKTS